MVALATRSRNVRGLAQAYSLFERIPQTMHAALGELLTEIGLEESAAQKAAVAKASGYLAGGLSFQVMLEQLRVRIGLIAGRGRRSSRYYGRFVEYGRRAQIVRVTRGTTASKRSASTRRRRSQGLTVRKPYNMRVRAMAARPFVRRGDREMERRIDRRTSDFWSKVLDRSGVIR